MPGFLDKAKSAITDNLGITEKAIIEVIDMSGKEVKEQDAVQVVGKKKGVPDAKGSSGKAFVNKGLLSDAVANTMGSNQVTDRFVETISKNGKRYFTVQFNPSTLSLTGHAGGLVQKLSFNQTNMDLMNGNNHSASFTKGTTTITLSVSLLFDSCDPQGAFLDDKLTLNATNVGKGIAKAAMQATGNKKVSVQTEVEGFIAALRNRYTRIITFHWGEFNYSGVLRNVSANYTMFNPNGEPIRATVELSMACADEERWPNSLAVWQERYKASFKKSESFVKTAQKMGKLLNI